MIARRKAFESSSFILQEEFKLATNGIQFYVIGPQ